MCGILTDDVFVAAFDLAEEVENLVSAAAAMEPFAVADVAPERQ